MKRKIERVAERIAKRDGLVNLNRTDVCNESGIAPGSFAHIMEVSWIDFVESLRERGFPTGTPLKGKRISPALRRQTILSAALDEAREGNYLTITREAIAERAGVSVALVTRYFGTMVQFRRDLVRYAIAVRCVPVIGQAIANRDPRVDKIDPGLKTAALQYLSE